MLNDRRQSPDVKLSLSDIFLFADSVSENRIEFAKIIIAGDRAFFEANQEKAEMNRGIKQSD